jgi:cytidylate kinase
LKVNRKFKVIAIDGPAGSGKSTTAKLVAKKLGFLYLDTGAMYRALTYKVIRKKIDPGSSSDVVSLLKNTKLSVQSQRGNCKIILDGKAVSSRLRSKAIEENVSAVSRHAAVRKMMVFLQRDVARKGNLVIEGRDTTSVVFPDADLRIYLEASLNERAKRRTKIKGALRLQKMELARRDRFDSTRRIAPLKKTRGSIVVDTTRLSIPQQVNRVLELYRRKVERR